MEPITTMSAATLATIASQNVIIFCKDPFAMALTVGIAFILRANLRAKNK